MGFQPPRVVEAMEVTAEEVVAALSTDPELCAQVTHQLSLLVLDPWHQSHNCHKRYLSIHPRSGKTVGAQVALEASGRWSARVGPVGLREGVGSMHDTLEEALAWADQAADDFGYLRLATPLFPSRL